MRFFYKNKGTISVFLCLILLPTILVGGMTVDASRIYMSKVVISDAGEMAMNAGLAQYNEVLHDEYGLLVMNESPEAMSGDLEKYFEQSLNGEGLPSAEDYDKMLDLLKKNFEAINVTGSEIYRTEVEKQQIIEYMKYRAPVCLAEEVIDKFKQLQDTKKMTEAMEAEIDFGEAMQDCQDAFQEAKEALDLLNQKIEGFPSDDTIRRELENTQRDFTETVSRNVLMREVIQKYDGKAQSTDLKAMAEAFIEAAGRVNFSALSSSETFNAYMDCMYYMNTVSHLGGIQKLLQDYDQAKSEQEESENIQEEENGGNTEEQEVPETETPQVDQEREDLQKIVNDYNTQTGRIQGYANALLSEANDCVTSHFNTLSGYRSLAGEAENVAKTAYDKLKKVKELLDTASDKFYTWDEKNAALNSVGKSGDMNNRVEYYRSFFFSGEGASDIKQVEELLADVEMNRNYFGEVADILEEEKFFGKMVAKDSADSQMNTYISKAEAAVDGTEITYSDIESVRGIYSSNYVHTALSLSYSKRNIKDNDFYKKLQQYCSGEKASDGGNYQNTANDKLKEGAAAGKAVLETDGYPNFNWGEAGVTLPSSLTGAAASNANSAVTDIDGGNNISSASDRRNIVSKFKESIQAANSFLEGVDSIVADGLENLYIAEYAMQMFSYYTVDKENGQDRPAADIISISGYDLQDRAGYKGECEYILWGNPEAQKNVQNTMMMIFGIRLLFNSFYAFTDGTIEGIATATAATVGTVAPYLVPLVKIVVKLGFAGAETANDMTKLKQGYGVTILKDSSTWATLNGGNNTEGITFDYSEYLRVFLNVSIAAGHEVDALARIADCIQVNEPDIDLQTSYTMLAVEAEVSTRTTFMRKISDWGSNGSWGFPDDSYTITYQSILGY